ncbi:MAG: cation-transporting P-type ATPase [Actinomycetota bacterium]
MTMSLPDPAAASTPAADIPVPPPGEEGLTSREAAALLARHGRNSLVPEKKRAGWFYWIIHLLSDPMALLLLVAGPTYLLIGDATDAIVTFAALVPIVGVSWVLETRAERTLEQLKKLTAPTITVWRDGLHQVIKAEELVPGDLVVLHEGDVVPADGELVAATQMMVDESALTGESQPIDKMPSGAEREVLAGTTVLSGRGIARITVTGMATRYGAIGKLVAEVKQPRTPLQRSISRLVRRLGIGAIGFCGIVLAVELARGNGWGAAVIAAVSLAIAAIPEEFPMVFTLYLALGARRLAQERALVRRLTGVETLGSTTVVCSDKTGTLTLGRLEVVGLAGSEGPLSADRPLDPNARALLESALLACEPKPFDPLERAISSFAQERGIDVEGLHGGTFVSDYPFDHTLKYLTHVWKQGERYLVCAKGSIEGILERSRVDESTRRRAHETNSALAAQGMRVIAVAEGELNVPTGERAKDEAALAFRGLVAFSDPLRPGVAEALEECRAAGIRVIMITGDHPETAHAVAEGLGLPHTNAAGQDMLATGADIDAADDEALPALVDGINVFARTRPEQKHRLVQALRAYGHVVAMTGDGINDAPALREADIGVAMGQRGTEVARESATMVLLDDNFATIVTAVRNGRRIFDNLRKAFAYLVAFHPPLLVAALVVPLLGKPLLLLPVHIVLLELIVHPTVSLVFEAEPAHPRIMARGPRPAGSGLFGRDLILPFMLGLTLSLAVVMTYLVGLNRLGSEVEARTLAFATLLIGQALLVLVTRAHEPVWRTSLRKNRMLLPVVAGTLAALPAFVYLSPLARVLKLAPFPPGGWAVAVAVAAVATLWFEPFKTRKREA